MLSLLIRRVAFSSHTSAATYTRILQSPASTLRSRRILGNCLHTNTESFANSQRNASTKVVAKTAKAKSAAAGKEEPRQKLTPEQKAAQKEVLQAKKELDRKKKAEKAAALRTQRKAQLEKKKAAALRQRHLVEKNKKLTQKVKAEKERAKIIEPPPRRLSAFAFFVKESGKPVTEVFGDWHRLSEEEKQDYVARARVLYEKRKEEFNAFLKSVTPEEIRRYNRYQKSRGKQRINFKSESNDSHSGNRWISFMREFRAQPDQAGKPIAETAKAGSEAWRSLTEEEKDKYKSVSGGSPIA